MRRRRPDQKQLSSRKEFKTRTIYRQPSPLDRVDENPSPNSSTPNRDKIVAFSPFLDDFEINTTKDSVTYSSGSKSHSSPRANLSELPNRLIAEESTDHLHTVAPLFCSFIRPPPENISEESLEYLSRKEAFEIPSTEFRDELIRSYINYVHPTLPVVNLQSLLCAVEGDNKYEGTLSLLVFQSIMFIGALYVNLSSFRNMGFHTREKAIRVLFNRAKLLYEFDFEPDEVAVVQALLLMSYCGNLTGGYKDGRHWTGIAVSICLKEQGECDNARSILDSQYLRRRVWWCCFLRELVQSLFAKLPPRMVVSHLSYRVLDSSDIEIISTEKNGPDSAARDTAILRDPCKQNELVKIFLDHMRLCIQFSKFLEKGKDGIDVDAFELVTWSQQLHIPSHWTLSAPDSLVDGVECIALHGAVVRITYFRVINDLHLRQVSTLTKQAALQDDISYLQRSAHRRFLQSSREMVTLGIYFYKLDLLEFLPVYILESLLSATQTFLDNIDNTLIGMVGEDGSRCETEIAALKSKLQSLLKFP
ncbi:uncharacterized protein N7458_005854 [Penicillium daleae]|uniref:Xylanolytic transcriptional activator regulatory domain-containing protein n=1 Tax=Penicillium daleae TaxID=63821 RepID=A0AAD6G4A4_9EURO|nr:uncharacterized protein N7458_005854 [Penicillium daleae]KAJ5454898.1 hypothetical protein N7458_005854 [Penicillium daleae]